MTPPISLISASLSGCCQSSTARSSAMCEPLVVPLSGVMPSCSTKRYHTYRNQSTQAAAEVAASSVGCQPCLRGNKVVLGSKGSHSCTLAEQPPQQPTHPHHTNGPSTTQPAQTCSGSHCRLSAAALTALLSSAFGLAVSVQKLHAIWHR